MLKNNKNKTLFTIISFLIFSPFGQSQEGDGERESINEPSPIQSETLPMTGNDYIYGYGDTTLDDKYLNRKDQMPNLNITGTAKVIDGDTITINGTKIRFSGIDAPESYFYGQTQYCQKPNGKIWACGKKATAKLKELINNQEVKCTDEGRDKYDRTLSICYANGVDLQSEMVKSGMAIAYLKYSRRYENEMVEAMTNRVGIWSGNFLDPEDWRKENSRRN
jgi:endonuclease YncB( thermonuclease family)|tara:strand:- start:51 stop:713 length:663 start_codon:yes stop_codon:yes gene_type:complete